MLKLSWPMMAIGWIINLYQRSMASLERCLHILNEPTSNANEQEKDKKPETFDLEIKDLSFTYPDGKFPVLKNISFKLPAGKTLGITGPVGCGKTTLLRILTRMFEPSSGKILIGKVLVNDMNLTYNKSLFAVVPQETFLFSESIRENILFSLTDKENRELALKKAYSAGLGPDMNEFPDGINTLLGEKGVNLSGGQKQRLSLARALASERPFLLLDDCTSAVDTETEQEILTGIKNSDDPRTCIVVSHRMVSLQNADLIIYLENGQIVERGTHAELLKHAGRYSRTWERQRLKEELEKSNA
jgi:ATP-binding cassette subfamily B protein